MRRSGPSIVCNVESLPFNLPHCLSQNSWTRALESLVKGCQGRSGGRWAQDKNKKFQAALRVYSGNSLDTSSLSINYQQTHPPSQNHVSSIENPAKWNLPMAISIQAWTQNQEQDKSRQQAQARSRQQVQAEKSWFFEEKACSSRG